jgi:hypothetical protein
MGPSVHHHHLHNHPQLTSAVREYCGDLPTPLVDGQTSWVYSSIPVQSLYISFYVIDNKLV